MTLLPERRALTRADLAALPDDGHRYELIDGSLIVTPSPSLRHQAAISELMRALQAACPEHLYILTAPIDVTFADDTVLQPDLLVVERAALLGSPVDLRPRLVIEVLSPSTQRIDLTLKKSRYEAAGTPGYWVVDTEQPSITAWNLTDGRYGDPQVATGVELLRVADPFELALSPRGLVL